MKSLKFTQFSILRLSVLSECAKLDVQLTFILDLLNPKIFTFKKLEIKDFLGPFTIVISKQ